MTPPNLLLMSSGFPMLTDRAFACLLIAALLLCGVARFAVGTVRHDSEVSARRQGLVNFPVSHRVT
jgi:hypothetical protein